jgi:hypothetical protein
MRAQLNRTRYSLREALTSILPPRQQSTLLRTILTFLENADLKSARR